MKDPTARHLRWSAAAVGCAFLVALLASDFFGELSAGFPTALDGSRLQLFLLNDPCPHHVGLCPSPLNRVDVFLVDVPIKLLAAVTIVAMLALLFMASQRAHRDSN